MADKYWNLIDSETEQSVIIGTAFSVTEEQVEQAISEYKNLEDPDEYESMEEFLETKLEGFEYVSWDEVYH